MALGRNSMRVNIGGEDDTVELTLRDGQWISENNDVVEIEFMAITAENEWNRFCDQQLFQAEVDEWAAKPLPLGCVPASATGRAWN